MDRRAFIKLSSMVAAGIKMPIPPASAPVRPSTVTMGVDVAGGPDIELYALWVHDECILINGERVTPIPSDFCIIYSPTVWSE